MDSDKGIAHRNLKVMKKRLVEGSRESKKVGEQAPGPGVGVRLVHLSSCKDIRRACVGEQVSAMDGKIP